jgi:RimJ/RimL family protein N-acetyltransferase
MRTDMNDPDIRLRDVTAEDLSVFYEHQRDPEATRMAAFESRDRDAFMAHWNRIVADPALIARTVTVDGRVAGNVVCFDQGGQRLVGYWIGREYWGRGVATRALSLLVDEVHERPLYAHVATTNPASRRVLEKCGFTMWPDPANPTILTSSDGVEEFVLALNATPG